MKPKHILIVMIAVLVLALMIAAGAGALDLIPNEVQLFEYAGMNCVVWPDGSGDCYCPCGGDDAVCNLVPQEVETPQETQRPPDSTPTPPTEKPHCNRGIGNGSENCDPGRSFGQGRGGGRPAGEDRDE